MKEEEAKTKVCKRVPVCTQIETSTSGCQKLFYDEHIIGCIASNCALWVNLGLYDGKHHGYCGLIKT